MKTKTDVDRAQLTNLREFVGARQCPDHSGKWPRGTCLQCEVEKLRKLVVQGLEVVEDFMPNIGVCALQDYGRMNRFTIDAQCVRIDYLKTK